MQRITAGFHGQVDQLARVQVAGQRVVTQAVGFVGALDVQGMAVGFGISAQARTMRTAISPRLAMRIFFSKGQAPLAAGPLRRLSDRLVAGFDK
jgi:hypothetical protein